MKNIHLMPMNSNFETILMDILNGNMPIESNVFITKQPNEKNAEYENCFVKPEWFSPEYINEHCSEYKYIVLQSLFFSPDEILRLSDETCKKMIWSVWGHDLYTVKKKQKPSFKKIIHESIHFFKMLLRGTFIRARKKNKKVADKVAMFHCITAGFKYDEIMIRKKYGNKVPVKNAPYFSGTKIEEWREIKKNRLETKRDCVNILIGHSGFEFLEHEKYLKKFSRYKNENININLVLSYGASEARIEKLTRLAYSIYGEDKCTILTEMIPKEEYYHFLSTMDIAVFPYKHQSALGNVRFLSYCGVKMFLNPKGIVYKGFTSDGIEMFDCHKIGRVSFRKLIEYKDNISEKSPQFQYMINYSGNIKKWLVILEN